MTPEFDVIVVGSGPAGVSAAFPLLEAGLRVLLVDGGRLPTLAPPSDRYLLARRENSEQWRWMLGADFHALRTLDAVSPKLRASTLAYVFEGFAEANRIRTHNFVAMGSLSAGGLSNAWGCGVAKLSAAQLAEFPLPPAALDVSYEAVTRRMGVSGAVADDLSDYFGVDDWAQPPVPIDVLHGSLLRRYAARRSTLAAQGFRMGRARAAVLSRDQGGRQGCDLSGTCLWGCHRKALYAASDEIAALRAYPNLTYRSGMIVDNVRTDGGGATIEAHHEGQRTTATARRVVLAAGTLASTRLALAALRLTAPRPLLSCPTAAFLLWQPGLLGQPRTDGFGLGQLSFALSLRDGITGFGSTFAATGIPVAELLRRVPLRQRYAIDLLEKLLSSCLLGNVFLPGQLSTSTAVLDHRGDLLVKGGYSDETAPLMKSAAGLLRRSFGKIGALVVPMSFTAGPPGGDIHYAGTLPMDPDPGAAETARGRGDGARRHPVLRRRPGRLPHRRACQRYPRNRIR